MPLLLYIAILFILIQVTHIAKNPVLHEQSLTVRDDTNTSRIDDLMLQQYVHFLKHTKSGREQHDYALNHPYKLEQVKPKHTKIDKSRYTVTPVVHGNIQINEI